MTESTQVPRYTLWQAMSAAISISMRAIEEVRALSRQPGPQGDRGADGHLKAVRTYESGVNYEGDLVSHQGSTYQAQRDTANEPPHADWICLAARGADGVDGRSIEIRGLWSEADAYSKLDAVTLNGGMFIARRDNPGPCPGDGWQLTASQGRTGKPGERGGPGPRGDRGMEGLPVVDLSVDDNGILTLTNADGSVVTCDLYPLLSKVR